ncbi:hypothetical protein CCM_03726 [Cordyceps militaris CM01]|uniref:DUF8035 domain-containing protein n=1 Tax=Cordyceps militaris (strain CM01) TaxID=983644 RepID=G3JG76_CORMM|nr:uncharacterized protein CCM_03726 [Cordyceps militaris CM01]EGX92354.1 hypothetical protein CCM_03726 [Cordyceps militaris CM01]
MRPDHSTRFKRSRNCFPLFFFLLLNNFEETEYVSQPSRSRGGDQVRVLERDREHDVYMDQHRDRTPAFLRDAGRRAEPGPMVLRRREVESFDRHARSPSPPPPTRIVEERIVRRARSESPPPARERSRTRIVETERTVSPVRRRVVVARSPSPTVRFVEHVRDRSPSPFSDDLDREHIRIVERERGRSPERSPSPPPPVIKAPTIEREVITHYTDIDHGMIRARQPSPPPPRQPRTYDDVRETDIDIVLDKHHTDVDIRRTTGRSGSRSRSRHHRFHDDEDEDDVSIYDDRLRVDLVDVPPGTERVRMDGAGGARTDTTWSKYSGERRTKFVPDVAAAPKTTPPSRSRERRMSVAVVDRDLEIDIESRRRRHRSRSRPKVVAPPPPPREKWTQVSRTVVSREAIERLGYPYQEARDYFYIQTFLPSDAVSDLIDLSAEIRRARRRGTQREMELDIEIDRTAHHTRPVHRRRRRSSGYLDERFRELEVSIDERRPRGGRYY